MGGKDSKKDHKKDPRKESGSSSKGKSKEKAASSSSKSKEKGIPIPSSKGKERSTRSQDDYYATSPTQSSSFVGGAEAWSQAQLSRSPIGEDVAEEDGIDLDAAEGAYSQLPPGSNEWDLEDDNISPLRDVGLSYSTGNYGQPSAVATATYSRTRFSESQPPYEYGTQDMGYDGSTGLESAMGAIQFQSSNRGYGYNIGKQVVMAIGSAAGAYAASKGGAYGNSSTGDSNQDSTPRAYNKPPSVGGNTNYKFQRPAYQNAKFRKVLINNDFRVHKSKEFELGRIVKLFWFEPEGSNARNTSGYPSSRGGTAIQRQGIPGKVRRFAITETYRGHSIGIPIHTYGYRGTTKPGCHPETHAMIYTNPEPGYLAGEAPLVNPKIRMQPIQGSGERLDVESRLNYAKKYTIEHNFQVAFIGTIAPESQDQFWMSLNRIQQAAQAYAGGYNAGMAGGGGSTIV